MPDLEQPAKTAATKRSKKHAITACVFSFLTPGLGQAYSGDLVKTAVWGLPLPLVVLLFSPNRILSSLVGLVIILLVQLCVSILSSVAAYRCESKRAGVGSASDLAWQVRVLCVVVAGACIGAVNLRNAASLTYKAFILTADSMAPTLVRGDRVVVDKNYYRHHMLQAGDVVTITWPDNVNVLIIKRIAALGGDVIEGKNGDVLVNGKPFDPNHRFDPAQLGALPDWMVNFGPSAIPKGKVFVLGDNRGRSLDSRSPDFGPEDESSVKGKILYIYWSKDFSRIGRKIE